MPPPDPKKPVPARRAVLLLPVETALHPDRSGSERAPNARRLFFETLEKTNSSKPIPATYFSIAPVETGSQNQAQTQTLPPETEHALIYAS